MSVFREGEYKRYIYVHKLDVNWEAASFIPQAFMHTFMWTVWSGCNPCYGILVQRTELIGLGHEVRVET